MRGALLGLSLTWCACAHAPAEPTPPPVAPEEPAPPPVDPQVADAQASAAFEALEPGFEVQRGINVDDPKKLKAALTTKLQGLSRLEREYRAVIQLRSPAWTVAAWARIGMLYDDFAQFLRRAPAPASLTEEQLEMYRSELNNRAVPLEAKATEAFQQVIALESAALPGTDWLRHAQERLKQLGPPTP